MCHFVTWIKTKWHSWLKKMLNMHPTSASVVHIQQVLNLYVNTKSVGLISMHISVHCLLMVMLYVIKRVLNIYPYVMTIKLISMIYY